MNSIFKGMTSRLSASVGGGGGGVNRGGHLSNLQDKSDCKARNK